jgi:putative hemolysin
MSLLVVELLFVVLLVLANGLFAMSEIAVISSRKVRLAERAAAGDRGAVVALELAESPTRLLSTVQIGITFIGILAGAVGGAGLADFVAVALERVPALAPYAETIGVALVVVGIGYLSLVFGELAPKRAALASPERIASLVARPMRALSRLAAPFVKVLGVSTDLVLRVMGLHDVKEAPVTEQEIRVLIEQATEAGVFEDAEQDMVENVFRLGDLLVQDLMTHRSDVEWLDVDAPPERLTERLKSTIHSRLPVCRGSFDEIVGVVHARDLLARLIAGKPLDLAAVARPALYMPEQASAFRTLEMLKRARRHTAFVVDEYGVPQGLVTYRDILEAVVGETPAIGESAESAPVEREDGTWLVDGATNVYDLDEMFGLRGLPGYASGAYRTLGGFIIHRLGRIPAPADKVELRGFGFEVVDMDGRRVDKVLVTPPSKSHTDKPEKQD